MNIYPKNRIPPDLLQYFEPAEIGLEPTPGEYVAKLVEVFREVRRVLRDDGTLWLNLGDCYASSGGVGQPHRDSSGGIGNKGTRGEQGYHAAGGGFVRPDTARDGLKPKDLLGIPWRVAFALQADGWYLRQDIIWSKPNPMPESVRDRCTKAHEYIFLLSKSERYHFDADAIKERSVTNDPRRPYGSPGANKLDPRGAQGRGENRKRDEFNGKTNALPGREAFRAFTEFRNRRSVWTVTTKPFKGAHFATFPPDLIEPCILAGCPVGGTVLDPFLGSGTTAMVALRNGRSAIGCELNPEYVEIAKKRISTAEALF